MEGMHILNERKDGNPMGIGYSANQAGYDLVEHREKLGCLCIHCANVLEQHWQVTKLWANEWKATIEKLEERIAKLEAGSAYWKEAYLEKSNEEGVD